MNGLALSALIPDEGRNPAGFQDSLPFEPRFRHAEPVERLTRDGEIDQTCRAGSWLPPLRRRIGNLGSREQLFACLPHLPIWFDSRHGIALFQKGGRQQAGS